MVHWVFLDSHDADAKVSRCCSCGSQTLLFEMLDPSKMSGLTSVTPQPDDLVEGRRTCISECMCIINKRRSHLKRVGDLRLHRYDSVYMGWYMDEPCSPRVGLTFSPGVSLTSLLEYHWYHLALELIFELFVFLVMLSSTMIQRQYFLSWLGKFTASGDLFKRTLMAFEIAQVRRPGFRMGQPRNPCKNMATQCIHHCYEVYYATLSKAWWPVHPFT